MLARLLLLFAIATAGTPAFAHEVRPAFLQITEVEPASYDMVWKTPAQADMRLALNVVLPSGCRNVGQPRTTPVEGAVIQRWRSQCDGALPGKQIAIENLEASLTDVILRFEPLTGSPKTLRMDGANPQVVIPLRQSVWDIGWSYFPLGVEHILFGFDHLLFVLCLLILVRSPGRLVGAVTAFTVAHSITLAGTTLGWIHLASAPVEACIALSIAFLAAEIIRARRGSVSTTRRWPWIASFAFGLLHGFGFAAALNEIGLPDEAIPLALLFFNLGVEAGQILFVSAVLVAMACWKKYVPRPSAGMGIWAWRAPPYVAGIVASLWCVERTLRIFV
jgi:hydrogenase/urease accessory protein HupE